MKRLSNQNSNSTIWREQGSLASTGNAQPASSDDAKVIYQTAQSTIMAQQQQIDSLRAVLKLSESNDGQLVAPELNIVFPDVVDISVSRNVFTAVETNTTDTVNVALIHFSRHITADQRIRLKEYLEARLKLKDIEIVTIPAIKNEKKNE